MRPLRIVTPIALGAGLVAATYVPGTISSPTAAVDDLPAVAAQSVDDPVAHTSGTDAIVITLPSVVDSRVERSKAALARSTVAVDRGTSPNRGLNAAVVNMQQAWAGAQYVLQTTPPAPVAEEGSVQASAGSVPVAGGTFAGPEDTAFAVLNLQHEIVVTALGLLDSADAASAPAIDAAITAAMTARDDAIAYIHSLVPPAPPAEEGGEEAAVSTWDTVMPGASVVLDDEIQFATALQQLVPASPVDLQSVIGRATATKTTVDQFWPPVPAED